jgi:hypothetical protein
MILHHSYWYLTINNRAKVPVIIPRRKKLRTTALDRFLPFKTLPTQRQLSDAKQT